MEECWSYGHILMWVELILVELILILVGGGGSNRLELVE